VLAAVLLNIFINDTGSGIECTLKNFATGTKLSNTVDTPEGWDAMQRDLEKLERWTCVNLVMFNKAKCRVLHLVWGNSQYHTGSGMKGWSTALPRRTCGY